MRSHKLSLDGGPEVDVSFWVDYASVETTVPEEWFRLAALDTPRMHVLPMPRMQRVRPNVGRSPRGRRVRTSRTSRGAPARSDPSEPPLHDVTRGPRGLVGVGQA